MKKYFNKKVNKVFTVFISLLMAFSSINTPVYAEGINVIKQGSVDTFINNVPMPDHFIDMSLITNENVIISVKDSNLSVHDFYNYNGATFKGIIIDNLTKDEMKTSSGFTVAYPGSVILANGERGDLEIDVSNISVGLASSSQQEATEHNAIFHIAQNGFPWFSNYPLNSEYVIYMSQQEIDDLPASQWQI